MIAAIAVSSLIANPLRADLEYVTGITGLGVPTRTLSPNLGVGMKFRNNSGHPLVVTQLGRWVIAGNSQTHTLSIYATDGTQLASVNVNCSGATPGQFLYGTLNTPYVIDPGQIVYLISSELHGGSNDQWYNSNNTVVTTTTVVGNHQSAYYRGGSTFVDAGNNGGPRTSAGPVSFRYSSPIPGWEKENTTYHTDGDQYSVFDALTVSNPGDTITVPAGTFTWASNGSPIVLNKAVSLIGQGPLLTTINIPADGLTGVAGNIQITAPAVVGEFKVKCVVPNTTVFNASTAHGWRITNVVYDSANTTGATGYFLFASSYGLVDRCVINGAGGSEEWIFARGPTNSWQTESSMGTADAIYLENCTFNNQGYMDFNSNARAVVRFSTINASVNLIKVDAHGYTTNSPARSARHTEVYGNKWINTVGNRPGIELRGGTGMVFDNLNLNVNSAFLLVDYGYQTNLSNYGHYQTPFDYPLIDQIGVGMDPRVGGSEPLYAWHNHRPVEPTIWGRSLASLGPPSSYTTNNAGYPIGSTVITLTGGGGGGGNGLIGAGDAVAFAGDTNRYLVTSGVASNTSFPATVTIASPGLLQAIPPVATTMTSGPLTLYQQQTNNPVATFTEADVVKANRDFFMQGLTFDGSGGVGRGTKSDMLAVPNPETRLLNVGFWVTNEGDWNETFMVAIAAPDIQAGYLCEIVTTGNTSFTDIGAASNAIGTIFTATGPGTGTGTVKPADGGQWQDGLPATMAATAIKAGDLCEVVSLGDTLFTAIGASANLIGTVFTATGPGIGTGTVKAAQGRLYTWKEVVEEGVPVRKWVVQYTPYTYPHPKRRPLVPTPIGLTAP